MYSITREVEHKFVTDVYMRLRVKEEHALQQT